MSVPMLAAENRGEARLELHQTLEPLAWFAGCWWAPQTHLLFVLPWSLEAIGPLCKDMLWGGRLSAKAPGLSSVGLGSTAPGTSAQPGIRQSGPIEAEGPPAAWAEATGLLALPAPTGLPSGLTVGARRRESTHLEVMRGPWKEFEKKKRESKGWRGNTYNRVQKNNQKKNW